MRTRFNRIHQVHPEFATEAQHFELLHNTLECTSLQCFVDLLKQDVGRVKLCLRDVELWTDWGVRMPRQNMLQDIVTFAKANKKSKIMIGLSSLKYTDVDAKKLLLFVAYGRGIREAVRGIPSGMAMVNDLGIIGGWRNGQSVSVLDAENVRFTPGDQVFVYDIFRMQLTVASIELPSFRKALAPYHPDTSKAIKLLIPDVKSWFTEGF
jgi:hypothetical protein